ncbi:uncharacterized protein BO80DRAFT_180989 [Aspergillus ibericus CBS 121593]|uniref:Uncharacterized protein n=1 Tax=Aspergillus ibericus CBS 121593 TaxID=1448316 RepID=A0A395GQH9_9EURO|nr:hypothetical protein BO80DRAFT_180989 [Aspergillus ibericus CBS 121593]RAK97791.1 hypothetical protein BO80DRAFT_180989 [Aspergillus ibericus CBS 121593]
MTTSNHVERSVVIWWSFMTISSGDAPRISGMYFYWPSFLSVDYLIAVAVFFFY